MLFNTDAGTFTMTATKETKQICECIFSLTGGKETEVIIFSSESALTRFADNAISQNVANRSREIIIRVMDEGRVARVELNHSGERELKSAVECALAMLKLQKPDPRLLPLAEPCGVKENAGLYCGDTAGFSPTDRAGRLIELVKECKSAGQEASGTLDNGWTEVTVANSKGVFAFHRETESTLSVTVKDGDAMGWAEEFHHDIKKLDFTGVGRTAREKARMAKNPKPIKPGRYTVVLEPDPVANMFLFMSIYGFGGQFFLEGQSFMSGKMGQKVLGDNITIGDNAVDGPGSGMPFDFEGMPRKKVMLVEKGVAKGVVHDRKTSRDSKTPATGHALPTPNAYGPIPSNIFLKPGDSSVEEMIKNTGRGVLVTQFHYVNVLKPLEMEITGMTRNGTYWIEDGKIAHPIKNMRFTESIVDALNRVEEIGSRPVRSSAFFGGKFLVPPLKIRDFCFSSVTGF